jgi:YggT family protein
MSAFFGFLAIVVEIFVFVLVVYAVMSWIPSSVGGPAERLQRVLGAVCEPVLRPVRRLIPPVRTGGGAIDLSVLVVLVVMWVLIGVLHSA